MTTFSVWAPAAARVEVEVAGQRHLGWVHVPAETIGGQVTEMADYRQPA